MRITLLLLLILLRLLLLSRLLLLTLVRRLFLLFRLLFLFFSRADEGRCKKEKPGGRETASSQSTVRGIHEGGQANVGWKPEEVH